MSSTQSDIFSIRLREALKLRKISQVDLAEKTGLQASAVSHFISGGRKPSLENIRRISTALNVSADFLLGRTNDPAGTSQDVDQFNRYFQNIRTDQDREKVIEYMRMLAQKAENNGQ